MWRSSKLPSCLLSWLPKIKCSIDCILAPKSRPGFSLNFHLVHEFVTSSLYRAYSVESVTSLPREIYAQDWSWQIIYVDAFECQPLATVQPATRPGWFSTPQWFLDSLYERISWFKVPGLLFPVPIDFVLNIGQVRRLQGLFALKTAPEILCARPFWVELIIINLLFEQLWFNNCISNQLVVIIRHVRCGHGHIIL